MEKEVKDKKTVSKTATAKKPTVKKENESVKTTSKKTVSKTTNSTSKVGRPKGEERIEREFYETKTGKIARVILVIACTIMVGGCLAEIIFGLIYRNSTHVKEILDALSYIVKYGFMFTLLYFVLYEAYKDKNK